MMDVYSGGRGLGMKHWRLDCEGLPQPRHIKCLWNVPDTVYLEYGDNVLLLFCYSTSPGQLEQVTLDPNASANATIPCK